MNVAESIGVLRLSRGGEKKGERGRVERGRAFRKRNGII